jgi:hypothetical protein
VYTILPVSLHCLDKQNKKNTEKLATWGTQDEEKQGNNNAGKLVTWGTQDEEKQGKNNFVL